jgi:hypothetical protein
VTAIVGVVVVTCITAVITQGRWPGVPIVKLNQTLAHQIAQAGQLVVDDLFWAEAKGATAVDVRLRDEDGYFVVDEPRVKPPRRD